MNLFLTIKWNYSIITNRLLHCKAIIFSMVEILIDRFYLGERENNYNRIHTKNIKRTICVEESKNIYQNSKKRTY